MFRNIRIPGRGPEETDGDQRRQMEAWQLINQSLGGGPQTNNGTANGGGGHLILLKYVLLTM